MLDSDTGSSQNVPDLSVPAKLFAQVGHDTVWQRRGTSLLYREMLQRYVDDHAGNTGPSNSCG
jgi:hypothetical protein